MTDQLCGGRGLPEEGRKVVWWTKSIKTIGVLAQRASAEPIGKLLFFGSGGESSLPESVLGWAYLSEVRAVPKMIAALERQVSNIDHWISTGEAASPEESKSIYEQMNQALADAKGGV